MSNVGVWGTLCPSLLDFFFIFYLFLFIFFIFVFFNVLLSSKLKNNKK